MSLVSGEMAALNGVDDDADSEVEEEKEERLADDGGSARGREVGVWMIPGDVVDSRHSRGGPRAVEVGLG